MPGDGRRSRRRTPARTLAGLAVLAVLVGVGCAGPDDGTGGSSAPAPGVTVSPTVPTPPRASPTASPTSSPSAPSGTGHGRHQPPRGGSSSEEGYVLRPLASTVTAGERVPYSFVIEGPDGGPVTDFATTHEKELHLIVVRRDLSRYQHVHPERQADGTWSGHLSLEDAGAYRVFADFAPRALGEPLTLGADLRVSRGDVDDVEEVVILPAPASTVEVDGYTVALATTALDASPVTLSFTVSRAGSPVRDLEPYLGALGHLVALRVDDLAYLHTHPSQHAAGLGGPDVLMETSFPSAGRYRLFFEFQHAGEVRTAGFTVAVPEGAGAADGHDEHDEHEEHEEGHDTGHEHEGHEGH